MASTVLSDVIASGSRFERGLKPEERAKRTEMAARLDEEARDNWGDPTWHAEQAAVVAEYLNYWFESESLLGTFFDVRTVGEFDTPEIRVTEGLRAFWTALGGYIEESQLHDRQIKVPRDAVGFHVSEYEGKIKSGYAEYLSNLMRLGKMRIDGEIHRRMFNLLHAVTGQGSAQYIDATGTGLTAEVLNRAISEVADAPRPDGSPATQISVVSRAAGINAISAFPGYGNEALEEIRKRGQLGVYRGANVVQLHHVTDETGTPFVDAKDVYVFAGDVGTFFRFGNLESWNWIEPMRRYRHDVARQQCGGIVSRPQLVRRIRIAA